MTTIDNKEKVGIKVSSWIPYALVDLKGDVLTLKEFFIDKYNINK